MLSVRQSIMAPTKQLAIALQYHQSGKLDAAERTYRAVLSASPRNADAWHLSGLLALQSGNAEQAVERIRRAIRVNGNVAIYHCNLGVALCLLNRADEAVASFRKAIDLNPSHAEAYNNLANALCQQGKRDEAIDAWRRAVTLKPDYAEAWNNLGSTYRACGDMAEAVACFREVTRLKRGDADSANNLAAALHQQGKLDEAAAWYHRAIEQAPNFTPAYNNLANVLKEQGRPAEAIACYQRALELNQDFAEARVGLAATQHEMGRSEDAIINYSMAILSKPDLAPAHSNLGIICEERGDFAQAERLFRAAIRSDPRFAAAHAELAGLLRGRLPDADRQAMQTLLLDQSLNDEQRAMLHFGLVQAFDARGEYVQAAEHSLAANALRLVQWRAAGQHYNRAAHTGFINRLIAQFSPEYFARVRDWGNTSPRPVFIVGMPRSGTTLLEQILGGHSQVFAAGELTLGRDGFETAFGHAPPSFNPEPTATEQRLRDEIDREFVQRLAAAHLADLEHRNSTAERVVSKLPENYLYLGYLATILPRAKIIHCRRDPRDVALSCWLTNFRMVRWASDAEDIASRFRQYERLMAHWREVLPVAMLEVSYEETVRDLEQVARRLVARCGLEWEPACLEFHRVRRPVQTASAVQVRQPLYGGSVGKWQHYADLLKPLFTGLES